MAKQSRILERDAAVCSKIEMTYFTGVRPMNETCEVKFARLIIFKTFRRAMSVITVIKGPTNIRKFLSADLMFC